MGHTVQPIGDTLDTFVLAMNIAIAFCMGTDIEGIMDSDIGQPLAAVSFLDDIHSLNPQLILLLDILQQLRTKGYLRNLVRSRAHPVGYGLEHRPIYLATSIRLFA